MARTIKVFDVELDLELGDKGLNLNINQDFADLISEEKFKEITHKLSPHVIEFVNAIIYDVKENNKNA